MNRWCLLVNAGVAAAIATQAYLVAYPGVEPEQAKKYASRLRAKEDVVAALAAGEKVLTNAVQVGLNEAAKQIRQGIIRKPKISQAITGAKQQTASEAHGVLVQRVAFLNLIKF